VDAFFLTTFLVGVGGVEVADVVEAELLVPAASVTFSVGLVFSTDLLRVGRVELIFLITTSQAIVLYE
jgi:hypothetical protein